MDEIRGLGAEVIAISTNNVDSLVPWAKELGISFIAAADFWPHGEVSARYGLLEPHGVPARAIMLVDEDGRVRYSELYPEDEVPECEPAIEVLRQMRSEG
jgi:peroxiredoxin